MQRILVIGSPGAGKSRLARRLGDRLGLPVIHLDAHYWQPGWVEPAPGQWHAQVQALLAHPAWVMDGNYSGTLPQRLQACDTVVFLDVPRWRCLWQVLWRWCRQRGRVRVDMAPGCPEKLDLEFVGFVLGYPRRSRPRVLALLEQAAGRVAVHRLRSRRQVRAFLSALHGRGG